MERGSVPISTVLMQANGLTTQGRGGRGASRGGGRAGGGGSHPQRKENILDLSKYQDKSIRVRFTGGREGTFYPICSLVSLLILGFAAVGILKGYDQLMNLVLDNVEEHIRGKQPRAELRVNFDRSRGWFIN